jgi:two-component system chemotaxis sensor kinase CheA
MDRKQAEFLKHLRALFRVEAQEHLAALRSALVHLEQAEPEQKPAHLEIMFRAAHSLKGAARAVNLTLVETSCHKLEEVLAQWRRLGPPAAARVFDFVHQSADLLEQLIAAAVPESRTENHPNADSLASQIDQLLCELTPPGPTNSPARPGSSSAKPNPPAPGLPSPPSTAATHPSEPALPEEPARPRLPDLQKIREILNREPRSPKHATPAPPANPPQAGQPSPLPPPAASLETIRVATRKLDGLLLQTEELLAVKQAMAHTEHGLRDLQSGLKQWRRTWDRAKPHAQALRLARTSQPQSPDSSFAALADYLAWHQDRLDKLTSELGAILQHIHHRQRTGTNLIDNLIEDMKTVLMRPASVMFDGMDHAVRDLASDLGKDVELVSHCGSIEIDRRILEELKDPLLHLLRNCVDHGVEKPDERRAKGKRPRGRISISLRQTSGNEIELVVEDDGAGIDPERVKAAAIEQGYLTEEKARTLTPEAAANLVFQSGFSTSPIITKLSGRGLGLSIVRDRVDKLGGRITLRSSPSQGAAFHITLPTTRATFRGVLVRAGDEWFAFPTQAVERVIRVRRAEVNIIENQECIRLSGRLIALVALSRLLDQPPAPPGTSNTAPFPAVVASSNGIVMAFAVDEILNEQEVLVRNLGPQLLRIRNVEGATVLENGRIVPILHVPDLIRSGALAGSPSTPEPTAPAATTQSGRKRILIVEDSITSRTLIKNILEAARYEVHTAVDGMEGFAKLREDRFDLVVSDVEMPRLHGFDLTARIRADKHLAQLPVILVTARESQEDLEKGVEVGANAYIVKSSFDQGNLLDVVHRLI